MCNIFLTYNQLAAFGRFLRKNTGEYDGAKEGCAQLFYNWYEKDKMHEIKPMSMKCFNIRTPSEISVLERNT